MLIINDDGDLLTVREFVEWEYNGGRGDFQPDTTFRTWNSLPVDAKIGYVACSVYGDIVGESKLFLKTDNKTYLLHNAQNDVKKLEAIDEYLHEVYRQAEHSAHTTKVAIRTESKKVSYEKGDIILPSEKSAWFEDEKLGAIKSIEYLPVNQEALKEVLRAEKERRTKQAKTTTVSI